MTLSKKTQPSLDQHQDQDEIQVLFDQQGSIRTHHHHRTNNHPPPPSDQKTISIVKQPNQQQQLDDNHFLIPIHELSIYYDHHLPNNRSTQLLAFSSSDPLHHPSRSSILLEVDSIRGLEFKLQTTLDSSSSHLSPIRYSPLVSIRPNRLIEISFKKKFQLVSTHHQAIGSYQNQKLIEYHLKIIYHDENKKPHLPHYSFDPVKSRQPRQLDSQKTGSETTSVKRPNQNDVIVISSDDDEDDRSKAKKPSRPRRSNHRRLICDSSDDENIKLEDDHPPKSLPDHHPHPLPPSQPSGSNQQPPEPQTRCEIVCQFDLSGYNHPGYPSTSFDDFKLLNHDLHSIQLKKDEHDDHLQTDHHQPQLLVSKDEKSFTDLHQFILHLNQHFHPTNTHRPQTAVTEPTEVDDHEMKIDGTLTHGPAQNEELEHASEVHIDQVVHPRRENAEDVDQSPVPQEVSEVPNEYRAPDGPRAETFEGGGGGGGDDDDDQTRNLHSTTDDHGHDHHQNRLMDDHHNDDHPNELTAEESMTDDDRMAANQPSTQEHDDHQHHLMIDTENSPTGVAIDESMQGDDRPYNQHVGNEDGPNQRLAHPDHGDRPTIPVRSDESMKHIEQTQDPPTANIGSDRNELVTEELMTCVDPVQDQQVDNCHDPSHEPKELGQDQTMKDGEDRVEDQTMVDDEHDGRVVQNEPATDELMLEDDGRNENQEPHQSVTMNNATMQGEDFRERFSPSCSPIDDYLGFPSQSQRRVSSIASSSSEGGDQTLGCFETEEEADNEPSLDDFMQFLSRQQSILNDAIPTTTQSTTPPLEDSLDPDGHQVLGSIPSIQPTTIVTSAPLNEQAIAATGGGVSTADDLLTLNIHQGVPLDPESNDEVVMEKSARLDFFNASDAFQSHLLIDPQPSMIFHDFPFSLSMDSTHPPIIDVSAPSGHPSCTTPRVEISPPHPTAAPIDRPSPSPDLSTPAVPPPTSARVVEQTGLDPSGSPINQPSPNPDRSTSAVPQPTNTRDTPDEDETPVAGYSPTCPPSIEGVTAFGEVESDPEDETYDPNSRMRGSLAGLSGSEDEDEEDLEARTDWEEESGSSIGESVTLGEDERHLDGTRLEYHELSLRYAGLKDYMREFKQGVRSKLRSLRVKNKIYRQGYRKKSSALKLLRSRIKTRDDRILELELDYRSSLEDLRRSCVELRDSRVYRNLRESNQALIAAKYQIAILIEKVNLFELIKTDLEAENSRLSQRLSSLEAAATTSSSTTTDTTPGFRNDLPQFH